MVAVPVLRIDPADDRPLPAYAHDGDAGADLLAAHDSKLEPGGRARIGTGIAIAIPPGHVGMVVPRSGLAFRHGVVCLNTPGIVDAGYRGELMVLLVNTDRDEPYVVHRGDRIAQLLIQRVERAEFELTDALDDATRGDAGFGSTGR